MTSPILSIRDLSVDIPTRHGILRPVSAVSYDIAPGEILGIVGESGAENQWQAMLSSAFSARLRISLPEKST